MDSILTSIKKLIGIEEDYTQFDKDLIIHINTVFAILAQLGVGPENGFTITDKSATWTQFIGDSADNLEAVKTYMYLKVFLLFDHTLSGPASEAIKQSINELEWRLNVAADHTGDHLLSREGREYVSG